MLWCIRSIYHSIDLEFLTEYNRFKSAWCRSMSVLSQPSGRKRSAIKSTLLWAENLLTWKLKTILNKKMARVWNGVKVLIFILFLPKIQKYYVIWSIEVKAVKVTNLLSCPKCWSESRKKQRRQYTYANKALFWLYPQFTWTDCVYCHRSRRLAKLDYVSLSLCSVCLFAHGNEKSFLEHSFKKVKLILGM